jgi:hypothetical protein
MGSRAAILVAVLTPSLIRADEPAPKHRPAVEKGLSWLVKNQHRDGHWEAKGGFYPGPMTALAGMALLADGSTLREGRYADNLQRATRWILDRVQPNGLIAQRNVQQEYGRYMYSHGMSLWFLAQVYGDVEDTEQRRLMADALARAVQFSAEAQVLRGGWGYVSRADGNDFDEGAVTYVQLHALFAARNAGIAVPRKVLDAVSGYLRKGQGADGGIIYSLANAGGAGRPIISAEALAAVLGTQMLDRDRTARLTKFVSASFPLDRPFKFNGLDSVYGHFYVSQVAFQLGEGGYAKLVPDSKPEERLTWSRYQAVVFKQLVEQQQADGSWNDTTIGPVFATACALVVLQRDLQPRPSISR